MQRTFLNAPERLEPRVHVCPLTPGSGFSILHESDQWLIWIIVDGVIDLYACSYFDEVIDTLVAKEPTLRAAWEEAGKTEDFAAAWQRAMQEVAARFDASSTCASGVNERLKRQLLWAFDARGVLDADCFLTILAHEGAMLSERELIALVAEMVLGLRAELWPQRTGGGGKPTMN